MRQSSTRLQVTALPVLSEKDSEKVASGVLDYAAALLDPTRTWIKSGASVDYVPIKASGWCDSELHLHDPADQSRLLSDGNISTLNIYRIYFSKNTERWIVYVKGSNPGEVRRLGPANIDDLDLIKVDDENVTCPSQVCRLSQLSDLIVEAGRLRTVGCSK